jgi:hypothetical protein
MANTKGRIPNRDADFDGWFENLKNGVVEKTEGHAPEWTNIPPEKVTALAGHYTVWHTAYQNILGLHTPKGVKQRFLSTSTSCLSR